MPGPGPTPSELRYIDPALPGDHETELYPGETFIDRTITIENVDSHGETWGGFYVSGEWKSREFKRRVYPCPNDPAQYTFQQPALADGWFAGVRSGGTDFLAPNLDGDTRLGLGSALDAFGASLPQVAAGEEPPPKGAYELVGVQALGVFSREPVASLLTFNNAGQCVAQWNNQLKVSEGGTLQPLTGAANAPLAAGNIVALGDRGLILTGGGFLAKIGQTAAEGYQPIAAPYDRQWVPAGPIYWQDFDETTLTAVGTQYVTKDNVFQAVIMKNGAALPLSDLCPGHPKIEFHGAAQRPQIINKDGMMVAVVDTDKGLAVALLAPLGLTADADNNNGYDFPDRTYEEVAKRDLQIELPGIKHPDYSIGKLVDVEKFTRDSDGDSVPNFAEGLSLDGNTYLFGGSNDAPVSFIPVVLQLPKLCAWDKLKIKFTYGASESAVPIWSPHVFSRSRILAIMGKTGA